MNGVSIVFLVIVAITVSAAKQDEVIAIVSQEQDISPDGSFKSRWETANGIIVEESGTLKNAGQKDEAQSVQGSASWTAPDGTKFDLKWTADENGAVFEGAHLPTPPPTQPIPEAIQRALEWNAAHPEKQEAGEK